RRSPSRRRCNPRRLGVAGLVPRGVPWCVTERISQRSSATGREEAAMRRVVSVALLPAGAITLAAGAVSPSPSQTDCPFRPPRRRTGTSTRAPPPRAPPPPRRGGGRPPRRRLPPPPPPPPRLPAAGRARRGRRRPRRGEGRGRVRPRPALRAAVPDRRPAAA